MDVKTVGIVITGVGGQGIILASDILIEGLLDLGFDVKKTEQHGLSQRGGTVNCTIKYGPKIYSPMIGTHDADVIVSFEKTEGVRWLKALKPGGTLIVNEYELHPSSVNIGKEQYPSHVVEELCAQVENTMLVDAVKMAEEIGNQRLQSVIMLGMLIKILNFEGYDWQSIIRKNVPSAFIDMNIKAYQAGIAAAS